MSLAPAQKRWSLKKGLSLILGAALLAWMLGPFPGCGLGYPIVSALRGHPQGPHGTQPANLVGLWVRDEAKLNDFLGQAFYLMPDGRFAGRQGLTQRRWHFDRERLFIDAVSRCGNCYQGNVTSEFTMRFDGADQFTAANTDHDVSRGIGGTYRRLKIDHRLKTKVERWMESKNEDASFKGQMVQHAIEQFETLSNLSNK